MVNYVWQFSELTNRILQHALLSECIRARPNFPPTLHSQSDQILTHWTLQTKNTPLISLPVAAVRYQSNLRENGLVLEYNFRETELRKHGSKGRQDGRSQRLAVIIHPYSGNGERTRNGTRLYNLKATPVANFLKKDFTS